MLFLGPKLKILGIILTLSVFSVSLMTCEPLPVPCYRFSCDLAPLPTLSWEDIQAAGITTFVGQEVIVRSKIVWEQNTRDGSPSTGAFNLKLLFESADQFITNPAWQNEGRGNLFLRSTQILKYIDEEQDAESYALNCEELSNGMTDYLVQGFIKYRNNVTEEQLANPAFIEQGDNVVYWSQMFEFIAVMICTD